jgi:hypothetical protein
MHGSRMPFALAILLFSFVASLAEENVTRIEGDVQRPAVICAERHQQLTALIEDLGDAPNFGGDKLFNALRAITRADRTCAHGQVSRALSMYDEAVLGLVFSDRSRTVSP